ncbi:MAG: hypothetical protein EBX37_14830, partial [Alphaproteobacteria bacterium]|nr:hypothetical protein [Alphaproteobacteria bacterium]
MAVILEILPPPASIGGDIGAALLRHGEALRQGLAQRHGLMLRQGGQARGLGQDCEGWGGRMRGLDHRAILLGDHRRAELLGHEALPCLAQGAPPGRGGGQAGDGL